MPVVELVAFDGEAAAPRSATLRAVSDAAEHFGGFVIRDLDVSSDLRQELLSVTRQFFALPLRDKQRWVPDGWEDRAGFQQEGPDELFTAGRFDGPDQAMAAGYPLAVALTLAPNVWPDRPALMEVVWKTYYRAMESLSERLDRVLAAALDHDEDAWVDRFEGHLSTLSVRWHPPARRASAAAESTGRVIFDPAAAMSVGSLDDERPELGDRDGGWHPVPAVPDGFLVTIGTVARRWSGDRWHSPPVRTAAGEAGRWDGRLSITYVQRPHHDTLVS